MGHIHSDGQHRRSHNPQISPQFLGVEHIPEPADHQEVIEVEIDAEQQHENTDHKLVIGISIRTYTEIAVAEAAGASGAEGVDAGVKERHPSRQQQKDFQQRHDQVNAIENLGAVAHAADQLAHRGPRHLGPHQMHAVAIRHRKNCHHEDQHAHAAHPVGECPPEQDATGLGLDVGEDGGPGGGEAGDLLLKVTVAPKPGYERKGMDVYTTVSVPYTTAVFGGETLVHTLYGDVMCKIKEGTQSGSKIRLRGKGIVSMKDSSVHGDQYVTIQIEVPRNLSPQARQKLKEFEEICQGSSRTA